MSGELKIDDAARRDVDGARLAEQIGLDEPEIAWRKAFTNFTEADERRLDELEPMFEDIAEDLCGDFYDHLEAFDDAGAILASSSKSVAQLRQTQKQYLLDLGRGTYDEDYFAQRARIGKIHDMLDLGPRIYLGAYSQYYEGILAAIGERVKARLADEDGGEDTGEDGEALSPAAVDAVVEQSMSALKLLNLDQQVAMDTYIHSYNDELRDELQRQDRVAMEVSAAVGDLASNATDVSERTDRINDLATEQDDRTEAIADEVADMSATIEEIASSAAEVEATANTAAERAEEGHAAAADAIERMEAVNDSVDDVTADVDRLHERVEEIDAVVDVIDDIAEQTNILALNASIEAARAGQAGEGFAVVADEVKQLAEESRRQAQQIEETFAAIQAETDETVESLETTAGQVQAGIDEVEGALASLDEIVDAVEEAARGIGEVADATDDQAVSTEEVASLVDDASDLSTEVAAEIESIADANAKQTDRVENIEREIERLADRE
ncbi:MAG: globin-coupled sensor protein [Haloarculaceae archaeon]